MRVLQRQLLNERGISLIEMLVAFSITMVIISIEIPVILKINKYYTKIVTEDRNYFYAQEALNFIENETKQNTLNTSIIDNKIKINKLDGMKKNIYFVRINSSIGNIVVSYSKSGQPPTTNNILNNVRNFSYVQKSNLIYLEIITNDDRRFNRCVSIIQ